MCAGPNYAHRQKTDLNSRNTRVSIWGNFPRSRPARRDIGILKLLFRRMNGQTRYECIEGRRSGSVPGPFFPDRCSESPLEPPGLDMGQFSQIEVRTILGHGGYHTQGQNQAQKCILRGCFGYVLVRVRPPSSGPSPTIVKTPSQNAFLCVFWALSVVAHMTWDQALFPDRGLDE